MKDFSYRCPSDTARERSASRARDHSAVTAMDTTVAVTRLRPTSGIVNH